MVGPTLAMVVKGPPLWPARWTLNSVCSDPLNVQSVLIEVLLNTPHVQELIKKGDVVGVKEALVKSNEKGMQSFDTALYQLYLDGKITLEEAVSNADSRTNLEAKINFG